MPRWWPTSPPLIFSFVNSTSKWKFRKSALASRKESLDLTKTLEEHGINSILDVRQAEQLVYTAAADIADLNGASASRKITSASCWEIIPARSSRAERN